MRVQIAGVHESEIKDRADVFEQKIAALLVETVHAVVDSLSGPLSADDLAPIQTEWAKRIEKDLLPDIKQAYLDAAIGQRKRQRDALIEVLQQREAQTASAVALYSEDQPRDDHGRWGEGGGDSNSSGNCPPCPTVENDLSSGRMTSISGDHLGSLLTDMQNQPATNLAKLTVTGKGNENMYTNHVREIPRDQMPQLPTTVEGISEFRSRLTVAGFSQRLESVDPRTLKMTQNQLNSQKVAGMASSMRNGTMKDGVIFVSRDGSILDGHHRWAASSAVRAEGMNVSINVLRVDTDIDSLLKIAQGSSGPRRTMSADMKSTPPEPPNRNEPWIWIDGQWLLVITDTGDGVPESLDFPDDAPIPKVKAKPNAVGRSNVALYSEDQERDDHGRWGSGGGIGSDPITNVSDPLVQERLQTISDKSKANGTFTKDAAWYQDAHVLVGEHADAKGVDPRIFTGMVAATSPHCSWDTSVSGRLINIGLAEKAVDTARANPGVDGHELATAMAKPGMLRNSLANAVDIYNGVPIDEVLTSPKTRSFYNNLVDPTGTDSVTVDSQMIQAIHDDETVTKVGSAKNYAWAADQVRTFAKTTDMIPSSAQSVIWAQWRRDHP